jgi:hypothetical protein
LEKTTKPNSWDQYLALPIKCIRSAFLQQLFSDKAFFTICVALATPH